MLKQIRKKVGFQLVLAQLTLIIVLLCPLGFGTWVLVTDFGQFVSDINERSIKKHVYTYLNETAREQALKFDSYFEKIRVAAGIMGAEASEYYESMLRGDESSAVGPRLYYNEKNRIYQTAYEDAIVTVFWGEQGVTSKVTDELRVLSELDTILMQVKEELPNSHATHVLTVSGIGRYYTKNDEAKLTALSLPDPDDFDLRDGAPLTIFTNGLKKTDNACWTPAYKDDVIEGMMITASGPIVDSSGNFYGIVGVDLPLETVTESLLQFDLEMAGGPGESLFAFLVDEQGLFVSFPLDKLDLFGIEMDLSVFKDSSDIVSHSLEISKYPEIRQLQDKIIDNEKLLTSVTLEEKSYVIVSHSLEKIGWQLVLVTSEDELLQSITSTREALDATLSVLQKKYLYMGIVSCFSLLFFLMFITKKFIHPIKELALAASKIGEGDFGVQFEGKREDEIGQLGDSLEKMVIELNRADKLKKSYASVLERQIYERTLDIAAKNKELVSVIEKLNVEGERIKTVTDDLQENREQMQIITEHSLAGLCVIQNDSFTYINAGISHLTGYTLEEFNALKSFIDIVTPEYRDLLKEQISLRFEGVQGYPYQIKLHHKSGGSVDVLVEGKRITWKGEPAVLGTVVDISQVKKVEEQLRENELALQDSLMEKEVLLKEVYHRTKNNMLVIISLLSLQMDDVADENARRIFKETENRIRSMSLIHESLYSTENLASIDVGKYIDDVAKHLIYSMTVNDRINLDINCEDIVVSIDKAMPLGLIVNEIITNSIQHAFNECECGIIRVRLHSEQGNIFLEIGDDGCGMKEAFEDIVTGSLGMQIIKNLVEKQLKGDLQVDIAEGVRYRVKFVSN